MSSVFAFIILDVICIILSSMITLFHFINHYRLRRQCGTAISGDGGPMLKPSLSRQSSSIVIYDNGAQNNCCCCQIDIQCHRLCDHDKFMCCESKEDDVQCQPFLFVLFLWLNFCVCVLCTFIAYSASASSVQFNTAIVFCILICLLWETWFNYYRYYSTAHCMATLFNSDESMRFYCIVSRRFALFAMAFLPMCAALWLLDFSASGPWRVIWWMLFVAVIVMHFSYNFYCISKFTKLLLIQSNAMMAEFGGTTDMFAFNESMMASVKLMEKCSLLSTTLCTLYICLVSLIDAYSQQRAVMMSTVLQMYPLWAVICNFSFSLNFAKNREYIKNIFTAGHEHVAQLNIQEVAVGSNGDVDSAGARTVKMASHSTDAEDETSAVQKRPHSEHDQHTKDNNKPTLHAMSTGSTVLVTSQSDQTVPIAQKRKHQPLENVSEFRTRAQTEHSRQLQGRQHSRSRSRLQAPKINKTRSLTKFSEPLIPDKTPSLYCSKSADLVEHTNCNDDGDVDGVAELKRMFDARGQNAMPYSADNVLMMRAERGDMAELDEEEEEDADIEYVNYDRESMQFADTDDDETVHEVDVHHDMHMHLDVDDDKEENVEDVNTLHVLPVMSAASSRMSEMQKFGSKHRMGRSASYDVGAIDNELRKIKDLESTANVATADMNSGTKKRSVVFRSASDLMQNEQVAKELKKLNEIQHDNADDMVNLAYLLHKQGLYTPKNFNSIKQRLKLDER